MFWWKTPSNSSWNKQWRMLFPVSVRCSTWQTFDVASIQKITNFGRRKSWIKGKKIPSTPKATHQENICVAIPDLLPGICRSLHKVCVQAGIPRQLSTNPAGWDFFPFPTMQVLTSQNKPGSPGWVEFWGKVSDLCRSRFQSTFWHGRKGRLEGALQEQPQI